MRVSRTIPRVGDLIGTVICINTGGYNNITLGERYEAKTRIILDSSNTLDDTTFWITDDRGILRAVYKSHFITLSELRDNKLKSIGI